ncbi:MAG: SHOCT domain-containing protein [Deltaproteobacteria bacterium]|nr:SHOCT domain-containing protein [Deltaproteobacteria bacterium]
MSWQIIADKHHPSKGVNVRAIIFLLIFSSALLTGCAENSAVLRAKDTNSFFEDAVFKGETKVLDKDTTGSEQYRVYQQAATGFISVETCREEVEQKAFRHCENMGKSLKKLEERTSVPPHILGNFPRAELLFVCLPKPNSVSFEDQNYIKLTNLKKLLDNGTITKDEFEQQKAKILMQ